MLVNKERIRQDIENIARFGALEGGGVSRLALTPEDKASRDYLTKAMEEAGLIISVDAFGNMRGKRRGQEELAPVMIGSHLDTVPQGGNYDGIVGVVVALEVIRVLNELGQETLRPVELINFAVEESSRFGAGTLGSKVMVGHVTTEKLKTWKDKDGITLYQALQEFGLEPEALATAKVEGGQIHAFIETHIEQGRVLEAEELSIGVLTSIAAPTRLKVQVKGRADHSGATPMNLRQDALAAASEIVLGVEKIAAEEAGEHTVGTVGYVRVAPGVMNVIPGQAELGIDIRDINKESKKLAVDKVIKLLTEIEKKRQVKLEYEFLVNEDPVTLAPKIIKTIEEAVTKLGYPYKLMPSGAGHDAMHMTEITDVGMIFIPSKDGISHNIAEFSSWEDIAKAAEVLLHAVLTLANEA